MHMEGVLVDFFHLGMANAIRNFLSIGVSTPPCRSLRTPRGEHRGGKGPELEDQLLGRTSQTGMNQVGDVHLRALCQPSRPGAAFLKHLISKS